MADITVYASIGNSDDKLHQREWSSFCAMVSSAVRERAVQVHGEWYSTPTSPFQNACMCFEISDQSAEYLKARLAALCGAYGQDSIAWAVVKETEFIQ